MKYRIMVSPDAMKQLDELQADIRKAVVKTMKELEDNPTKSRPKADIKKLAGIKRKPSLYRLRAGEYRVIYEVTEGKVWISEIIKRSAAYKFIPP